MIEPVDPLGGGELDVLDGLPRTAGLDQLGLEHDAAASARPTPHSSRPAARRRRPRPGAPTAAPSRSRSPPTARPPGPSPPTPTPAHRGSRRPSAPPRSRSSGGYLLDEPGMTRSQPFPRIRVSGHAGAIRSPSSGSRGGQAGCLLTGCAAPAGAGLALDGGAGVEAVRDPAAPARVQVLRRPGAAGHNPRHRRLLPGPARTVLQSYLTGDQARVWQTQDLHDCAECGHLHIED